MKLSRLFLLPACMLVLAALVSFSKAGGLPEEVVTQTNEFRKSQGLEILVTNDELNKLAQKHSEAMAKGTTPFGHNGFDERNEQAAASIKSLHSFGENVASGPETAVEVMNDWKNSPGHRSNLLGKSFKYIGVGVARSAAGQLYYTQIFGG